MWLGASKGTTVPLGKETGSGRGATPLALLLDLGLEGLWMSACGPFLVFQQSCSSVLSELLPQFLQPFCPSCLLLVALFSQPLELELVIALRMSLISVGWLVLVSFSMACGFTLQEGVQPLPGRPP